MFDFFFLNQIATLLFHEVEIHGQFKILKIYSHPPPRNVYYNLKYKCDYISDFQVKHTIKLV